MQHSDCSDGKDRATNRTPRDTSTHKHTKPSHQVQSGAKNPPNQATNRTSRDTSTQKHTKPSHQVQSGAKNPPNQATNYTSRDTSTQKHTKPSHQVQSGDKLPRTRPDRFRSLAFRSDFTARDRKARRPGPCGSTERARAVCSPDLVVWKT